MKALSTHYMVARKITDRGQNKAGPRANCPQNLVPAHKTLRPRAQLMALELLANFNT